MARNLTGISATGLEALSFLSLGSWPSAEWRDLKLAQLDEAAKPHAALEFVVLPSLRKLVIAAVELPRLHTMSGSEWNNHVNSLASPAKK